MDLREFYAEVEALIGELRSAGNTGQSDVVESALRGGGTSGEILGRLSLALPTVAQAVPAIGERAHRLARWASDALGETH